MTPMLNIAVRAARAAGNVIARHLGQRSAMQISEKNPDDLVTNFDRECESILVTALQKSFPDHGILTEETGVIGDQEAEYQWVIDPIDGTTNFVQGIGHSAVSMALRRRGRTEIGVVFDPLLNEMFTAARGEGAALNGRRIRISGRDSLSGAIIGTAFPVRYRERMSDYLALFEKLIRRCADVRRMGAASLDLCYVACGRFDGYLEQGLKPWDFAAGDLIVREAGGLVTNFCGEPDYQEHGNLVAAGPKIMQQLLAYVCEPPTLAASLRG